MLAAVAKRLPQVADAMRLLPPQHLLADAMGPLSLKHHRADVTLLLSPKHLLAVAMRLLLLQHLLADVALLQRANLMDSLLAYVQWEAAADAMLLLPLLPLQHLLVVAMRLLPLQHHLADAMQLLLLQQHLHADVTLLLPADLTDSLLA